MIQDRKSKKGAAAGLIFAAVVLVLVVLLENLSSLLPSVPAVLQPTSQLFTVLKKGAVYSLVAVSMNLLNGFTGLFSLGQAGFMLLGAYTSPSSPSPSPPKIRCTTCTGAQRCPSPCLTCSAGWTPPRA